MPVPRLVYVGDVPASPTVAGAALLYRLLQAYPPDRLLVISEGTPARSDSRRLPGVRYETYDLPAERFLKTRFAPLAGAARFLTAGRQSHKIESAMKDFDPQAVLTVAAGVGWLAAAAIARRRRLPLHLIVHDEVMGTHPAPRWLGGWRRKTLAAVMRQAVSRMCVSPAMAEMYGKAFGVFATVLYPSRAADAPKFDAPPPRLSRAAAGLTYGYAGSIVSAGYWKAIASLAQAVAPAGGRVAIFSYASRPAGFDFPNVDFRGMVPYLELPTRLRDEVDVLYVPMSFDARDRVNTEISFPSKLADYTAVGIPLLIRGPGYCSAARWARENPGVAELIETEDPAPLAEAVRRLECDPAHRVRLGQAALSVGARMFSYGVVAAQFMSAIGGEASIGGESSSGADPSSGANPSRADGIASGTIKGVVNEMTSGADSSGRVNTSSGPAIANGSASESATAATSGGGNCPAEATP
jgi:glycosyltransferase involved in cell wall biosynthesis